MYADKWGDVLGYFIVVSVLFLPLVAFVPYAIFEYVKRFMLRPETGVSPELRKRKRYAQFHEIRRTPVSPVFTDQTGGPEPRDKRRAA